MWRSYEPSFEGLLSALAAALRAGDTGGGLVPEDAAQPPLLPCVPVPVENGIVEKMDRLLCRRMGTGVLDTLFHAYLSEQPDIADRLLGYLRLGLRLNSDPADMLQEPDVAAVRAADRAVTRQAHRYLGLLRFRPSGGVYVADFEPDCHLLPVVTPHFTERMSAVPFLIRDRRRRLASAYGPGRGWGIFELDATDPRSAPSPGDPVEDAWRSYFDAVAVPELIRPQLQRSHMPKKYWRYLVERPGR